jgi:hypothetical protein
MEAANDPLPRIATGTAWRRPDARALATSALVGGLGGVAAFAAATDALLDDGPQLVAEFGRPDGLPLWFHVLYFPAAALLRAAGVAPDRALLLVSVLATAVLLACVHAAAFVVTGQRRAALVATAAVALCPGVVLHATFIEVHALHAAAVAAAALAVVAAHARPRLVVAAACAGAAGIVLTHRSAALAAPALAVLTLAALQQRGVVHALRRAALAVAAGILVGYVADAVVHRVVGGPPLGESWFHVHAAMVSPSASHVLHEVVWPLGALWLGAWPWRRPTGRGGIALALASAAALVGHGAPIALAGIATRGGYALGAVPLLALGFAVQFTAVSGASSGASSGNLSRASSAARLAAPGAPPPPPPDPAAVAARRAGWRRRSVGLLVAGALLASAWWSWQAVGEPPRRELAALRRQRLALAAASLPAGGAVFGFDPSGQHVTGALPGVQEILAFQAWSQQVLANEPPAAVQQRLRAALDRALQQGPVLWTAEWRDAPLPPVVVALLTELEAALMQGLLRTEVATPPGRAWLVQR